MFSKSNDFKSEYCCTVVRIGTINPIAGKDRIGYTMVNGETIVIRKDMVKEGDTLIYASNETQLNKNFLGANNLFESSCCELNSNFNEVEPYLIKNKELKAKLEENEKHYNRFQHYYNFLVNFDAEYLAAESDEEKDELKAKNINICKSISRTCERRYAVPNDFIIAAQSKAYMLETLIKKIKNEIEKNTDFIRTHVGFFNKTGRVRAIKLGGIRSMGYLFSLDELAKYNPKVKDINLDELVNEDFDTVDGELFVKAYVPEVKEHKVRTKSEKRNKKIEQFDRMIKGEFSFNYDTQMFGRNVNLFKPTDKVVITNKLHGTSGCFGKVHVKMPIRLPIHKWLWNKFIDLTGLFKDKRIIDYKVEYGNVTSSRKVIKNQYINKDVKDGFYSVDVWSEYGDLIYPYLDEGMILYGEICGYETGKEKWIQKEYDYGCKVGENFLMPYRITTTNEDGTKKEWNVEDVYNWTVQLITNHPELGDKIHPITIFYHGTLGDLYPELSLIEHWHENLLEMMKNDKKHFGMEKNEPMCKNKVPREGICIRKDDDEIPECFKLKCNKFREWEAKLINDIEQGKEGISEEMAEVYS